MKRQRDYADEVDMEREEDLGVLCGCLSGLSLNTIFRSLYKRQYTEIPDEDGARREYRHQEEDLEELTRSIQKIYVRSPHLEYDKEAADVEQQPLLPSVRDPKLWIVKCAIGHEREVAVCLMQKAIDRGPELQIQSVLALDHLQGYIYVESEEEAHVTEACKGIHNIYAAEIMLVPIEDMTDILSVECKAVGLARGTVVRMKMGTYKGDIAEVVKYYALYVAMSIFDVLL